MQLTLFSIKSALALVATLAAIVSAFTLWVRSAGLLEPLELAHYDFVTSRLTSSELADDIAIVAIRDSDLTEWGWPISDGQLARLIEVAFDEGAVVVGVDIYRGRPVAPGTEALETALRHPRVTTIGKLGRSGNYVVAPPVASQEEGSFGFSDVPVDIDGVVRRSLILVNDGQTLKQAFALRVAMSALDMTELHPWPRAPHILQFGGTPVPPLTSGFGSYVGLDASGYQIMTRFDHSLPIAPILSVPDLLSGDAELAGKVVLIGLMSDSIKDHFVTPLNRYSGSYYAYGLQVHAALVQQLIDHAKNAIRPINDVPHWVQSIMLVVAAVLASVAVVVFRNPTVAIGLGSAGALALFVVLSTALEWQLWLPAVPVTINWILAFMLTFIVVAVKARLQRRVMSQLFESQLSPELAQEIWSQRHSILAKGQTIPRKLRVSLLFADVAGSTKVGGSAEPAAYLDWIGKLLDALSEDAVRHGGLVEMFTGDGILVAFGAPLARDNEEELKADARAACSCAMSMRETVARLNSSGEQHWPYAIRIGLHCGEVFGGTIGRKGSVRYNLVGDTVNVASRIEAFAKTLERRQTAPVTICCSADFVRLLDGFAQHVPAGTLVHDDEKTTYQIFSISGLMG